MTTTFQPLSLVAFGSPLAAHANLTRPAFSPSPLTGAFKAGNAFQDLFLRAEPELEARAEFFLVQSQPAEKLEPVPMQLPLEAPGPSMTRLWAPAAPYHPSMQCAGRGDIGRLIENLTHRDSYERYNAQHELKWLGRSAIPALNDALAPSHPVARRVAAAELLGETRSEAAVNPLRRALADPDPSVRCTVIKALGRLMSRDAIEPLLGIMSEPKSEEMHVDAAYALANLLSSLDAEEFDAQMRTDMLRCVELCSRVLADPDWNLRRAAAYALGATRSAGAVEPLIAALADPESSVRSMAAQSLGKLLDQRAVKPLIMALEDADDDVRAEAAQALGALGDAAAAEPLISQLGDPVERVALWAGKSLLSLGAPGRAALIRELGNEERAIRELAAITLRASQVSVTAQLIEALEDAEPNRRQYAAQLLAAFGAEALQPLVLRREAEDLEPFLALLGEEHLLWPDDFFRAFGELERSGYRAVLPAVKSRLAALPTEQQVQLLEQFECHDGDFHGMLLQDAPDEDAIFDLMVEKMTTKLSELLGIAIGPSGSGDVGAYGQVVPTMKMGMRQQMSLQMSLDLQGGITINNGNSDDASRQSIMRALNFVVHHEVGHLVHDALEMTEPTIKTRPFTRLSQERVSFHAAEIAVDKLAFDIARKVYVHGDGDLLFSEEMREAISIHSALALFGLVLEKETASEHPLEVEFLARFVAAMEEMGKSEHISAGAKKELKQLSQEYLSSIAEGRDPEYMEQVKRLIRAYRRIFQKTELPL